MSSEACSERPPPGLLRGIEQYNRGEFYDCHDTLEELWMAETRPIRQLFQGILQIGVAFYHLQSGRHRPALVLLERGRGYLQPFQPRCMGIEIAGLLVDSARCLAQIELLGPEDLEKFDWETVSKIKTG